MIETSRWVLHINNMFMHEDLTAQINVGEDGALEICAVTKDGLKPFPKELAEKIKVDGDTLSAEVEMEEMKGMKIKVEVTFHEDTAEGFFKLPLFGKLKFNGEKVEMTDIPEKTESEEADNA